MIIAFWFICRNRDLRNDTFGRFLNFRADKFLYYLLACLIMPVSILLAQAVSLLFGYSASQFVITGHFTFTSGVFPVWFLLILAPVIEELAWHSYGTDSLRSRMNLFAASLLFGLFWAIWHSPLALIKDYYHANVVNEGWLYSLNFMVSIIPYVILMNWLYYKTNRNILVAVVFHIAAGYFNEIFATHPDSKCIQTVILLIVSARVVIKERDLFFRKEII
jgi:membrane protease YdiL (CAAX protease family)